MEINKKKFITGKSIETEYATFKFLDFEQYIDYQDDLGIIALGTLNIYYHYKEVLPKPTEEETEFLKTLKDSPLRHIVMSDEFFLSKYLSIFDIAIDFKDGYSIESIFESDERFMEARKLIMDMNLAKEEKAFYNEELQEGVMRSKKMKSASGETQTSEDIITCIVASTSNSFDDVLSMTIYQAYAIYQRVGAIKNYDTGTLYRTVDNDVKVEEWNKHIDLLAGEKSKDMKREVVMAQDFS